MYTLNEKHLELVLVVFSSMQWVYVRMKAYLKLQLPLIKY